MIGKFVPLEDAAGSHLWFEVPEELQGLMYNYLKEVIGTHGGKLIKKKFMRDISKQTLKDEKYTPRIPVQFGNEVVFFYAYWGAWRVSALTHKLTINDLALKEEILLDIEAIAVTA